MEKNICFIFKILNPFHLIVDQGVQEKSQVYGGYEYNRKAIKWKES